MGASAFLESVDFSAFVVNVKTIAPKKYLYQFGHAIWWRQAPKIIYTFMESYNFSGKTIVPFCTSGSSGVGSSATNLHGFTSDAANWMDDTCFSFGASESDIKSCLNGLGLE